MTRPVRSNLGGPASGSPLLTARATRSPGRWRIVPVLATLAGHDAGVFDGMLPTVASDRQEPA